MKEILRKISSLFSAKSSSTETAVLTRSMLEKKVDQGVDKAVKQYGEVFRKLAEYDRQ